MPTDEIIIRLFLIVDERFGNCKKRSDAHLYVSEIITLGLLFALKGKRFSAFYRWLSANYADWFPSLPEHSRLSRLISEYSELADEFLADLTFFTVLDPIGIELIHPRREGRSKRQIGKKGISNGRWIVGIKLAWLINDRGEVVDWAWDTADAPDNVFRDFALLYNGRTITLTEQGLRERQAPPSNLKHCKRGQWNERFTIETNYSWLTELFDSKKLYHRVTKHLTAHLRYLAALMNCLLRITDGQRSLADFVI
jgi:hypothetical protein